MNDRNGGDILIFFGSPRPHGDTAALVDILMEELPGRCTLVDCWREDIHPCTDCRACRSQRGCAVEDGMQEIYRRIETCEGIVIASPVWFSGLTGRLLDTASRFQRYYSARAFRQEELIRRSGKGGMILVGGGNGSPENAMYTAGMLLRQLNIRDRYPPVLSMRTDTVPAAEDGSAIQAVRGLAEFLKRG